MVFVVNLVMVVFNDMHHSSCALEAMAKRNQALRDKARGKRAAGALQHVLCPEALT